MFKAVLSGEGKCRGMKRATIEGLVIVCPPSIFPVDSPRKMFLAISVGSAVYYGKFLPVLQLRVAPIAQLVRA